VSFAIRVYRPEDFERTVALWKACGLLQRHHVPARELPFVSAAPNAELFLAFEDGTLVGSALVGHDGNRAWLYRVGVDPAFRGRGYGRALVRHAEDWAIARGIPKLRLLILGGNEAVVEFYRRLGFAQESRIVMGKSFADGQKPSAAAHIPVVITFLEMTAPPARGQLPPPSAKLALLRVEKPSVAYYRFLYEQVGDPWFWYERKHLDDDALGAIIGNPQVELYVPYVAGAPAGFFEIDRRPAPDVSLAYFGLMPDYLGLGLGGYLLGVAIEAAWTSNPRRLIVDTCSLDHPRALQAYQKIGFRPYRQERRSIVDPRLTGKTPMRFVPRLA